MKVSRRSVPGAESGVWTDTGLPGPVTPLKQLLITILHPNTRHLVISNTYSPFGVTKLPQFAKEIVLFLFINRRFFVQYFRHFEALPLSHNLTAFWKITQFTLECCQWSLRHEAWCDGWLGRWWLGWIGGWSWVWKENSEYPVSYTHLTLPTNREV